MKEIKDKTERCEKHTIVLEAIICILVVIKLFSSTTNQNSLNLSMLKTHTDLTIALGQIYELDKGDQPELQDAFLRDIDRYIRSASDNITQYLGDKVPGCGYDEFGRPLNRTDARNGITFKSLSPAGKLIGVADRTEARYLDGTKCVGFIRNKGLLDSFYEDAAKSTYIETAIVILGILLIYIRIKIFNFKKGI